MEIRLTFKRRDPWSRIYKYKNCADTISTYWTRSGNVYTGLTEDDEKALEKALGFADGTLARYSNYWNTFGIKLGEDDVILHPEDNSWDKLQYLFLKSHKRVSNGRQDIKPGTDYVLINEDKEAKEVNVKNKAKRTAIKEFDKMSLEDMRKCLRLFGIKSDNISAELVESKLFDVIEKTPEKFIMKWVDNKEKNTEFIIEEAISKNIIRKSKNIYYYGTDLIGNSLQDAIANLNASKNQDLKLTILKEIESK
jgi:hypothetical protein